MMMNFKKNQNNAVCSILRRKSADICRLCERVRSIAGDSRQKLGG